MLFGKIISQEETIKASIRGEEMSEREELIKIVSEHPEITDRVLSLLLALKGLSLPDRSAEELNA